MSLALIAALTDSRVIGKDGGLPWKLSEDLKRFKRLTTGHTVLMGRKTWESLPKKPLPDRLNLILSRNTDLKAEGAQVVGTLEEAERLAKGTLFVIGGEAVFAAALPRADALYLTHIHHEFAGDVMFPDYDRRAFELKSREAFVSPEGWAYEFVDYQRRKQ